MSNLRIAQLSRHLAAPALVAAFVALSASAISAPWPMFGGDAGHSGHQPVDPGMVPVEPRWSAVGVTDQTVRTSVVVTSGGSDESSTAAYGTANGNVHSRRLTDGLPRGPQAGADVANDAPVADSDAFTGSPGGSVTPADTSTGAGEGMLLALHNDDDQDGTQNLGNNTRDPRFGGDIALAVVDPATGQVAADKTVGSQDPAQEDTINMTISSSPVLGPVLAGQTPTRELFFVAARAAAAVDPVATQTPCNPNASFDMVGAGGARGCNVPAETRLFRLLITSPGAPDAAVASVTSVVVAAANTQASPTLVRLSDPATNPATPRDLVAVATTDGFVRTYDRATLAAGPSSPDLGNAVSTPSVPVRSDGQMAGVDAPIYAAAVTGADTFKVFELRPSATAPAALTIVDPTRDESQPMSGVPSRALAVSAAAEDLPAGGRVVVAASRNLYSLDVNDLRSEVGNAFALSDSLAPGTTGFGRTTPALQGGLVYVQRDNGEHLVLDERSLDPVADFERHADGDGPAAEDGIGQPAISRGYVVFGGGDGAFAYRNETAPVVAMAAPERGATLSGTATVRATAYSLRSGISKVTFLLNGIAAGDGTLVRGSPGSATNPGVYELSLDTTRFGDGLYLLTATATDGDAGPEAPADSATSAGRPVTVANGAPDLISIGDVEITEGDAGTRSATFALSRTGAGEVTVKVATRGGTAIAGQDYDAVDTIVTFAPGDVTQTVSVPVRGDTADEPDESFTLVLSEPSGGATLADPSGLGTIRDDDVRPAGPGPEDPVLSISSATLGEGGRGDRRRMSFDVSLSRPAAGTVTVEYRTVDATARAREDYVAESGSVTIPAGELSRSVTVTLIGDNRLEGNEFFGVVLSNARGAGLGSVRGGGLIVDDEMRAGADRRTPALVTLSVTPRRDPRAPFRFRSTGTLITPASVAPAVGCSGRVAVQVRAARKTISTRRVRLLQNCTYSIRVTFRSRKRFTRDGRLGFTARFLGNGLLTPKKSRTIRARTR